jgi:hypothetical protein
MSTETWKLSLKHQLKVTPHTAFPETMDLLVDNSNTSFDHRICVKEDDNWIDRRFSCTWVTGKCELSLTADDGVKHYYQGKLHKRTISRHGCADTEVMIGILGHKKDPYGRDGVGDEDNVVVFTGVKGPVDD